MILVTDFMPPATNWGQDHTVHMPLEDATALVHCEDGQILAILYLHAHEVLRLIPSDGLFERVAALKQRSDWAYLVIGGELVQAGGDTRCEGQLRKWPWASVEGALLSVQEFGVGVVQIAHEADLGATAQRLARRDRSKKRVKQRDVSYYEPAEQMLLALPGLGPERVMAALDYAGSAGWALSALTDATTEIPGIGAATKAKIREALGLKPDEQIAVYIIDSAKMEKAA